MDELDRNLMEAWGEVTAKLRGDRGLARKRWRRSKGRTLQRPPRAWCMAVRASDTRLQGWNTLMDDRRAFETWQGHRLELDGKRLRELCGPVWLGWPGMRLVDAARELGRHPEALRYWLPKAGRPGRSRRVRAHKAPRRYEEVNEQGAVFCVRYEKAQCHGHFGMDVPVVWTDVPLNPGASFGRSPHAVWGSMWQYLGQGVQDEYVLQVERVPRYRPYGDGTERFRGWNFVCPGRYDPATGEHRSCGRLVQTLYGPLPVSTIAHRLNDDEGIDVGEANEGRGESGSKSGSEIESAKPQAADAGGLRGDFQGGFRGRLSGRWYPGVEDVLKGKRCFACSTCWRVRNFSLCDYRGWNEFVSYLSGGLLFGREVKRPGWLVYERKREVKRGARGRGRERGVGFGVSGAG